MRMIARTLLAVVAVGGLAEAATAQTPAAVPLTSTESISYTGTITAIDPAARLITTRGSDGVLATWDVQPSVPQTQVDGFRVGDVIDVTYSDAVGFRRKAAGEAAVDTVDPATRVRTATVTVTAIDLSARTVTLTGARGRIYTRRLVDQANLDLLRSVQVGDRVDVMWYETMQIAPGATTASTSDEDSLRHRFTVSAQWGPDNSFSGKMIKAATGRTTGGAPIQLDETSFDDVYGRMALFKVGVGYRISPRSEAVLNVVISRSSSETVQIGTVTTATLPVRVDFEDYNYWGVEAGQRFYLARARFTPYVGYLVGLNRFDDIRGEFVGGLSEVNLPGYAAQDGKFFEKSWAFSASPTGGILVGLGPFEVMAEVALRYMGGLSDVDWLVEEGLRDINSESSRWSIPILIGARVRF